MSNYEFDVAQEPAKAQGFLKDLERRFPGTKTNVINPRGPGGGWPQCTAEVPDQHKGAFEKHMKDVGGYEPDDIREMSAGGAGTMGYQIPIGIKQRKKKVDEALSLDPELTHGMLLTYFNGMNESITEQVCKQLDEGDYVTFGDGVKEHAVREMVRNKMKEVVRKKSGGGGYVLYSPNQGKKKPSKAVGNFPTKVGAKKAELARFPPKDPGKLKRLRKEVDRLLKDPKKRAEKEKSAAREKGTDDGRKKAAPAPKKKETKKESVAVTVAPDVKEIAADGPEGMALLQAAIGLLVNESLFHEEKTGSNWDEYITRLSKQALSSDKKFQALQKNIDKKTEKVLKDALAAVQKAVGKKVKIKEMGGIKVAGGPGKTYLPFSATVGQVAVEPIALYIEHGVPKIELSDQAKVALTKADPSESKLFRAELIQVQERILDRMDELERAVMNRDRYLEKQEDGVDEMVADLTPLQISLLKQVLVKKYRKIS
jgi:hypothetical protein